MGTVALTDFFIMRNYLIKLGGGFALLGAFVTIVGANRPLIILLVAFIMPLSCISSLSMIDDRSGWETFRLALPLTRADVVRGRYVSCAAATLLGVAFGSAAYLLAWAVTLTVPGAIAIARAPVVFDGAALALTLSASLALPLLATALTLPALMRFGLTRVTRFVPVIPLAAFMLVPYVQEPILAALEPLAPLAQQVQTLMATPAGLLAVACVPVVASVAVYAASCMASIRLSAKRAF